jgi:hypothetical protein
VEFKWELSVNKWSDVKCGDVEWTDVIYVKWHCFEVRWVSKVLGDKSTTYIRVNVSSYFFNIFLVLFCIIVYMVLCLVRFCLIAWIICSYCYVIYSHCYVFLLLYLSILIVILFRSVYFVSLCWCVLFLCKCVLYYCHRVSTQLLLNIYQYQYISTYQ